MSPQFIVRDWHAWAPALPDRAAWLDWAAAPHAPLGAESPALAEMAPMQRRRVDHLGRMALQVAWWCQPQADAATPLVFATRHGELSRTYDMLRTLARDEPLSPTHFGLSTHNAIGAQYGIARALPANYLAVSAGVATAEAAFVEALGLLVDGAQDVVVVMYEAPLAEAYAGFRDEPDADYAWAVRIGLAQAGDAGMALECGNAGTGTPASTASGLPHGLEVLRLLIGSNDTLELADGARRWRWKRHA